MKSNYGRFFMGFLVGMLVLAAVDVMAANVGIKETVSNNSILKITPGMSPAALASLSESESVQLPSGRIMKVKDLRRLSALSRKLKMAKKQPLPMALTYKPAATGIQLRNSADLSAALKLTDSETVQLPSGKLVTVGLLRYLQPLVEKRLGRKMTTSKQPISGKMVIKIKNTADKKYWKEILQKPDSTVLEAPDGQRITVGDLKLSLGGSSAASSAPLKR